MCVVWSRVGGGAQTAAALSWFYQKKLAHFVMHCAGVLVVMGAREERGLRGGDVRFRTPAAGGVCRGSASDRPYSPRHAATQLTLHTQRTCTSGDLARTASHSFHTASGSISLHARSGVKHGRSDTNVGGRYTIVCYMYTAVRLLVVMCRFNSLILRMSAPG